MDAPLRMVVPRPICLAAAHGNVEQLRAYFSAGDRDPNDIDEYSRVNRYDAPWMG